MNDMQAKVEEFHEAFGHPVGTTPQAIDKNLAKGRIEWMREEIDEYEEAVAAGDLVEQADALADLAYFLFGTAVIQGLNLQPIFDEVHRSNMSKLGADGKPIYSDGSDGLEPGKVKKGPNFFKPDLHPILAEQAGVG